MEKIVTVSLVFFLGSLFYVIGDEKVVEGFKERVIEVDVYFRKFVFLIILEVGGEKYMEVGKNIS